MSVEEEDYTKIILDRQKPMLRFSVFKERYLPLLFSEDPSLLIPDGWKMYQLVHI